MIVDRGLSLGEESTHKGDRFAVLAMTGGTAALLKRRLQCQLVNVIFI